MAYIIWGNILIELISRLTLKHIYMKDIEVAIKNFNG